MVQFSVKSLVPPSLPFLQLTHNHQLANQQSSTSSSLDFDELRWSLSRSSKLSMSSGIGESFIDQLHGSLNSSPRNHVDQREKTKHTSQSLDFTADSVDEPVIRVNGNYRHQTRSRDQVDGESGSEGEGATAADAATMFGSGDDEVDDEVEHQVISSLTRRKMKQIRLPEFHSLQNGHDQHDPESIHLSSSSINGASSNGNVTFGRRWSVAETDAAKPSEPAAAESTAGAATEAVADSGGRHSDIVCKLRANLLQVYNNMLCQGMLNKPLMMFVPTPEHHEDALTTDAADDDVDADHDNMT